MPKVKARTIAFPHLTKLQSRRTYFTKGIVSSIEEVIMTCGSQSVFSNSSVIVSRLNVQCIFLLLLRPPVLFMLCSWCQNVSDQLYCSSLLGDAFRLLVKGEGGNWIWGAKLCWRSHSLGGTGISRMAKAPSPLNVPLLLVMNELLCVSLSSENTLVEKS